MKIEPTWIEKRWSSESECLMCNGRAEQTVDIIFSYFNGTSGFVLLLVIFLIQRFPSENTP